MELMNLNGAQTMSSLENKHNIYVLEFSNGVIKVGRGKVKSRIQSHTSMAGIFNIEKTKVFTFYAKDPVYVEGLALNWMRSKCAVQKSNEWFYGCNFDDVVKFIEESKDLVGVKKEAALFKPTSLQALKIAELIGVNVDLNREEKLLLDQEGMGRHEVFVSSAFSLLDGDPHHGIYDSLMSLAKITQEQDVLIECGANPPEWYMNLNFCGDWYVALYCEALDISDGQRAGFSSFIIRACVDALDAYILEVKNEFAV